MAKSATFEQSFPSDERWLHQPAAMADLRAALEWARNNPPAESDLDFINALYPSDIQ